MLTYRFSAGSNTWQEVDAGDLAMAGWSNPAYYSTIQTGDIDGDGAAELLVRRAAGVTAYHFNTVNQTWGGPTSCGAGCPFSDAEGFDLNPAYYEPIQTGDIDGDGAAELLGRGPDGLLTYRFNTGSNTWQEVDAGDLGMGDTDRLPWSALRVLPPLGTGGGGSSTLDQSLGDFLTVEVCQVGTADEAAELLARYADGLHVFGFNTDSQDWENVPASPLGMTGGAWNEERFYSTIQTGDIDGDGAAELLARYGDGLHVFRFNTEADPPDWEEAGQPLLDMGTAGWDLPQHYRTIQTGDIDGDGAAELLARFGDGLHVFRFNAEAAPPYWVDVGASPLGMTGGAWNEPQHYSTIQTGDITGCGAVALFTDTIQLEDRIYQVDWQVAPGEIGESFEVHVTVAGLDLGYASYTPGTAGELPIRFRVDNHPLIRTRLLHEGGQTATQVAQVLADEFNWSLVGTLGLLFEEGYRGDEIGAMLRDVYSVDEPHDAAEILKSAGLSALETGRVLRDGYDQDAAAVALILYEVGYPIDEVIAAVEELFDVDEFFIGLFLKYKCGMGATAAASTLKDAGYSVIQAYAVLLQIYGVDDLDAAKGILLAAGFDPEQVTEQALGSQLAARFAPVLKFDGAASTFPMDAQKWWEEMLCGDEGGPPVVGGEYDYESCREHPDGWTTDNIAYIWNGSPLYSTLADYDYKVPTYYRVESCGSRGQVRIEYWWYYGWQPKCDCCSGDHPTDWEHIMVTTSEDWLDVAAVTYYQHAGWYTRIHGGGDPNFDLEGTHPVVFVGKTSHGSFHNDGGTGTCAYYEDWRNPGTNSTWRTWRTPLIDLKGSEQEWLDYDRTADWKWGDDGVSTHPTVATADLCAVQACEGWDPTAYVWDNASGCLLGYSDCRTGDCDCGFGLCSYSCWACVPWEEYEKDYWLSTIDDDLMP